MATRARFTVGRDTTTVGRWVRLVLGLLLILDVVLTMLSTTNRVAALPVLLSFLGILVVYYAAYLLLEKPLLARGRRWLNTLVFVVPALVIVFVPVFPAWLQLGMILYWGISLLVNALIRYGGCEVLAVPTLVYKRRYDVYCPTNVIDMAERAVAGSQGKDETPAPPKVNGTDARPGSDDAYGRTDRGS